MTKNKKNRYKPRPKPDNFQDEAAKRLITGMLKPAATVAGIGIFSLLCLFTHDFLTQSSFFKIRDIEVSGTRRIDRKEVEGMVDLSRSDNLLDLNLSSLKKKIITHPWIQAATVKRRLKSRLIITITEEEPLAVVRIENIADILINTEGKPFKEYDPGNDDISGLPVISGLELNRIEQEYRFDGELFNSIMDMLKTAPAAGGGIHSVKGDEQTGVTIETDDVYNRSENRTADTIFIRLGFTRFDEKLEKAMTISRYIKHKFPRKTIVSMDLSSMEKMFVKIDETESNANPMTKGV